MGCALLCIVFYNFYNLLQFFLPCCTIFSWNTPQTDALGKTNEYNNSTTERLLTTSALRCWCSWTQFTPNCSRSTRYVHFLLLQRCIANDCSVEGCHFLLSLTFFPLLESQMSRHQSQSWHFTPQQQIITFLHNSHNNAPSLAALQRAEKWSYVKIKGPLRV